MSEAAGVIITLSLFTVLLIVFLKGTIRILSNHFLLGVLLFIILTPIFIMWALIEGLFGD